MKKLVLGLCLLALLTAFSVWVLLVQGASYTPGTAPEKTDAAAAAAKPVAAATPAESPPKGNPKNDDPLPADACEALYARLSALDMAQLGEPDKAWLQKTLNSPNVLGSLVIVDYMTCEGMRLRSPAIPEFALPQGGVTPRGTQLFFASFFDFSARKMQPKQVEEGFADFPQEERELVHNYLAALSAGDPAFCQSLTKTPDLKSFCQWSITREDGLFPKVFIPFLEALATGQRGYILKIKEKHRLYPYSLIDTLMGDAGACKTMLAARKEELCQQRPYAAFPD